MNKAGILMIAKLSSNGRTTLPKPLRDALHLRPGDQIYFKQREDGVYTLRPRTMDVSELKGSITYSGPPVSLDDMEEAIANHDRLSKP
jgi:AbrB family looped-hinge helix DNA binding protein